MTTPAKFAVAVIALRHNVEVEGGWECILVARKDDHTRWSLPGGKVDAVGNGMIGPETSVLAAVREFREETGIDLGSIMKGELHHAHGLLHPIFRMIPQGTVLDSDGYFTTFYLLDTTGLELPETFKPRKGEAPVKWGPVEELLTGPYARENRERLEKLGVI